MTLKKKLLFFALFLATSFCLLAAMCFSWLHSGRLEQTCVNFLNQQEKMQITIGKIEPGFWNQIVVKDVVIKAKGENKPLAKAVAIKINYNFFTLLNDYQHFAQSIEKITLVKPQIFLQRDKENNWNYEKILSPSDKSQKKLSSDWLTKVILEEGEIFFIDGQKKIKNRHWQKVHGWVNLFANPQLDFSFQAVEGKTIFAVQGNCNLKTQQVEAKMDFENLSWSEWRTVLPKFKIINIKDGLLSGKVAIKGYYPQQLTYQGKIFVNEGSLKSKLIPLFAQKIEGQILLQPGKVTFRHLHGWLGQSPVQLNGSVYYGKATLLDLDLQSPDVQVKEISQQWLSQLKVVQKAENVHLHLTFLGPISQLLVQGQVQAQEGKIAGQKIKNLQAQILYKKKILEIQQASAQLSNGFLRGKGLIKLPAWHYQLTIQAEGLPLHALPLATSRLEDLDAQVGGTVLLTGTKNRLEKAGGTVSLANGSWRKMNFSSGEAKFFWQNGSLSLPYFVVRGNSINARVWGTSNAKRESSFQANISYLDLTTLANCFHPALQLKGQGSWQGTISTGKKGLQLQGKFFTNKGQLLAQDFSQLSGEITCKNKILSLSNIYFQDGTTRHYLTGTIDLAQDAKLDLTLTSKEAKLEKLVRLLNFPQNDLQGKVDSTIHIGGKARKIEAQGEISVQEGSWKEEQLDKAKVSFRWQNNTFYLEKMEAQQGETFLTAQGQWQKNGQGKLLLNAKNVDLEKIPSLRYRLPSGAKTVNFLGQIEFDRLKEIKLLPLIVVHGKNSYRLQGSVFNLTSYRPTMNLTVNVEKGDLTLLSAIIPADFPHNIKGQIQGKINFWGSLNNPSSRVMLNLKQGQVGDYPIESGKIDLVWNKNVLSLLHFRLQQGDGFIFAQGLMQTKGKADLTVKAENLDGRILSKLFLLPEQIEGKVQLTGRLLGKTNSPTIYGKIEVTAGKIRETSFDRLEGVGSWQNNLAKIDYLTISKDKYVLSAKGIVPTNKANKGMNLEIDMQQGDLGLLTMLLDKQVDWAKGQTKAWLNINGTWKKPLIQGEIKIDDGAIKLKELHQPLQHLSTSLLFSHDKLELQYLKGSLGGGDFSGSGQATDLFTNHSILDFHLHANNLYPQHDLFAGIINGDLYLKGSQEKPILSGDLIFTKGRANLSNYVGVGQGMQSNLKLDIGVKIGDNLRVKGMLADLFLNGQVYVGGTLAQPQLNGQLQAKKGTINYLGNKFRLTKANILFKPANGFIPQLNLEGKTRFRTNTIFLQVTGPATAINATFTSDPPMTQKEILLLLTFGRPVENSEGSESKINVGEEFVRLAGESLPLTFIQQLEDNLGNELGLDELYISQNIWKGPQITLGKSFLGEKMYLSYTLNTKVNEQLDVNGQFAAKQEKWYLEAQYKLPKNLNLNYSRNNLGDNKLMLTTSIRF